MMENEVYFDNDEMPKEIRRRKKQLYNDIRERMEFYFSDANLQKDRFLSKLIENDPEVDLAVFLRFNRIQQLTHSVRDLAKSLKKSELLQLNEDKTKVSRVTPVKVKENVDACTIYVEQLTPDADHDWLIKIFSKYGKVDYVSIPKYKSGKVKGFAFVEFEKPEYATKALEEFEKEGLCLTSQMNPEQLCSIATFEEDKPEVKEQAGQQEEENEAEKNEDKKAKKRKNKETKEEKKEEEPEEKKIKKDETKSENENTNADGDHANNENNNCNAGDQVIDENEAGPVKKKKNRKKKKSHKMKYVDDIKLYGLHILSKTDWKRLRNKYLNIQKEKMKRLKQHLYKSQLNHMQRQQQAAEQQQQQLPPTKPRFEFSSGLVVKVSFEEPLADNNQVSQFKGDAKSLDNVEYIDVTVGSTEGYVRFRDKETVKEMMQVKPWEHMALLEGREEQEYWEKMKKDREEKFENRKKFNNKKRGRNKLVNKAEKLISKRIRLSVDE